MTKRSYRLTANDSLARLRQKLLSFIITLVLCFSIIPSTKARNSSLLAAGVSLSATPTSRTLYAGQSTTYTINLNRDGYIGKVTLSASNLPSGAAAAFNPNPVTGSSSTLTVTTKATTPTGTFQIKIGGSAPGLTIAPINVTLIVRPAPIKLTAIPNTQSIIAGQSTSYKFQIMRNGYDGPVTMSVEGLPNGMTVSFEQNPVYGNTGTMRVYSHLLTFSPNRFNFDIIATTSDLYRFREPLLMMVNCGMHWLAQFGSVDADEAREVAVDANGDVYVVGNTTGTVDPQNPFQGATDAWVAKYDHRNGQQKWISQIGTTDVDQATAVAVDTAGNVFIGGFTAGTFASNVNLGNLDFWLAKYDSMGNRLWVIQGGTQEEDGSGGFEIVPDGAGGGKLTTIINNRRSVATYSFDPNGFIFGSATIGAIPQQLRDGPRDLAVGQDGSVYVVGDIATFDFLGHQTSGDFWVAKFDNQGTGLWREVSTTSVVFETTTRVAVDAAGSVFMTGTTRLSSGGNADGYIFKYDTDGNFLWNKTEISPEVDSSNAVAVDGNGDVIVAGMTQGVLGERNGDTPPRDDAWVAKRSGSTGDLVWVRQFPVADADGVNALAVDSSGVISLAGYTVNFRSNIGSLDAWVMHYSGVPGQLFSPSITSLSAYSGPVGTVIHINGNFVNSVTGVRFNGVPAVFTKNSFTDIEATVPADATDGLVTVTGNCESASSPMPFDVQ